MSLNCMNVVSQNSSYCSSKVDRSLRCWNMGLTTFAAHTYLPSRMLDSARSPRALPFRVTHHSVPVSLVAVSRHNTSSQLITCIASAHDMETEEGLHKLHH